MANENEPVEPRSLILPIMLTALSALIYMAVFYYGEQMRELFQGFGADLPPLTRFFLASYKYYGFLLLIGVVPYIFDLRQRNRPAVDSRWQQGVAWASFWLSTALFALSIVAAYLPIFQLGAII